jgi:hypothetical protein
MCIDELEIIKIHDIQLLLFVRVFAEDRRVLRDYFERDGVNIWNEGVGGRFKENL